MSGKRSLGSLLVQVGADTRGLNAALARGSESVRQFGGKLGRTATGARAQFSGMGNAASGAVSRMGALSSVANFAGPGAAVASVLSMASAPVKFVSKMSQGAHAYSPESQRKEAQNQIWEQRLNSQWAKQFPEMTSMFNNGMKSLELAITQAIVDNKKNDRDLFLLLADLLQLAFSGGGGSPGASLGRIAGSWAGNAAAGSGAPASDYGVSAGGSK